MAGSPEAESRRGIAGDLDRVAAALARAQGHREALRQRRTTLEREIALAKGRLAVRPEVEAFIEEVQAEASRRNVASFETLLTALVQEVLPGEKPIALDLSTERGLAALDIGVQRPDGSREDVLEDNGGALTNVVGMALRLIAVVKAGAGRFLALDEADCWIAPDRVPAFYRVLEDGAARLGVQCLAISHHDLARFEGRLHVARITGDPASGVGVASPALAAAWPPDAPGLRSIRLVDVQGYRDATLPLSPGVNALIGPNNRGKSTFIRALRAVFYGEARDSLVRAGASAAVIEIGVAGNRTLRFSRQPRRTPVNLWSLHEPDGAIVEEHGTRLETGGRAVPDWVDAMFGITKIEGLDVHIAHQKFPVFLLGEPASRRSAVLSIGQEASYLRTMLALHRERCTRDQATVRNGERELTAITQALAALDDLAGLEDALASARRLAAEVEAGAAAVESLVGHQARLQGLAAGHARAEDRLSAFAEWPGAERFEVIAAALETTRVEERTGRRVLETSAALTIAQRRQSALAGLPSAAPALEDTKAAERIAGTFGTLERSLAAAEARRREAEIGLAAIHASMERLLAETGGLCPACGTPVEPDALLDAHGHGPGREAA